MKKIVLLPLLFGSFICATAQNLLTPEMLWKLGRVNPVGLSNDGANVVFTVSIPNVETNKSGKKTYLISVNGGDAQEIPDSNDYVKNDRISRDGKYKLSTDEVKVKNVFGKDFYPALAR